MLSFHIEDKQFVCGNCRKLQLIIYVKGTDFPSLGQSPALMAQFTGASRQQGGILQVMVPIPQTDIMQTNEKLILYGPTLSDGSLMVLAHCLIEGLKLNCQCQGSRII